MPLLEALLTESYADSRAIYISLRNDGSGRGRGTIDDPYDGGTRLGPALSATLAYTAGEFVVGTQFPHGLQQTGGSVTISGVVGPGATWFNGSSFTVQQIISPLHFTLSKAGLPVAPPDVPYSYNPGLEAGGIGEAVEGRPGQGAHRASVARRDDDDAQMDRGAIADGQLELRGQ